MRKSTLKYANELFDYALKLTKNRADAEDLLQETYYRALLCPLKIDSKRKFVKIMQHRYQIWEVKERLYQSTLRKLVYPK